MCRSLGPVIVIAAAAFAVPVVAQDPAGRSAGPVAPTDVIASVAGKAIVVADVRDELVAERARDLARNRLDAYTSAARERALEQLIDVKLLAVEAAARAIDRNPDVKRRLDNLVEASLAGVLITDVARSVRVDDAALRQFYDKHLADFAPRPRRRARHIVVKTEAEAKQVEAELKNGAEFGQLAKAHNIDSTRDAGGELGWVTPGEMVPAFDEALFALKVGDTSSVVPTRMGFHLVQLEEIETVKPAEFDKVKDAVKQKLLDSEIAAFKQGLRAKYTVRTNKDLLAQVDR